MAPQQVTSPPCEETTTMATSSADNTAGPSTPTTATPTTTSDKKKRKASHEYSTNPNTIRVRERNASLSPYQLAVERAKSNDMKAVATAWKDRINTESFQASSEEARRKILEDVEKTVMDRRRRKKIDASSKILKLNEELKPDDDEAVVDPSDDATASVASVAAAAAATAEAGPQPPMAPPGYIAYPTQPIYDLMDYTKKKSSSGIGASAQASSSSSSTPARIGDGAAAQPTSASASPVASATNVDTNADLMITIEDLKAQLEAEKLRHENESIRQVAEMQELRRVVDGLKVQIQHMGVLIQTIQLSRVPPTTTYDHNFNTMTSQYAMPGFQYNNQPYGGGGHDDNGYNGNDGYATGDGLDGLDGVPTLGFTNGSSAAVGNVNRGTGGGFGFF